MISSSRGRPSARRAVRRRAPFVVWVGALIVLETVAFVSVGCGSTVVLEDPEGPGVGGEGGKGPDGGVVGPGGSTGDASQDAFDEYIEPPCPDAGPPIEAFECDPYNQASGQCLPTEGCYIFVEYPTEPCEQEIYGSLCLPAGSGGQGDPCGGPQSCGPGFVCVVSGSGTQCVELCSLTGQDGCPPGLVCESIDVQGFGGCL